MAQPVQHQAQPRRDYVLVVEPSAFFTRGKSYGVIKWNADGAPWVVNDTGSRTWLLDRRWWAPVPEPMTMARSQELLHARYRAERAAQQDA